MNANKAFFLKKKHIKDQNLLDMGKSHKKTNYTRSN